MDTTLVDTWVDKKIVSKTQAKRIVQEIEQHNAQIRTNRITTAVTLIGALLLGLSAILFVASNWDAMSNIVKTALLVVSTLASFGIGYWFSTGKSHQTMGHAFLFLSSILFGTTIILIAQMYHWNADTHVLSLLWLLGVLPITYLMRTKSFALLSCFLFILWIGQLVSDGTSWASVFELGPVSILFYGLVGTVLFCVGGVHKHYKKFHNVARIYRLVGIKITLFCLLIFTFGWAGDEFMKDISGFDSTTLFSIVIGALSLSCFAYIAFASMQKRAYLDQHEHWFVLGIMILWLAMILGPIQGLVYPLLCNVVFVALTLYLLWAGYGSQDAQLVNTGTWWLAVFILLRYIDWFWDLFDKSLFFFVGGLLLLGGGYYLEKKRREVVNTFK